MRLIPRYRRSLFPCDRRRRTSRRLSGCRRLFGVDVDKWAGLQPDAPARSEAIRRLVELGLTVKTRPVSMPGRRRRAQELAANAIDKMTDLAAPPDERAQRKRQLTKGPAEFREDRVDLPKPKK
jgi:hypothetical protein